MAFKTTHICRASETEFQAYPQEFSYADPLCDILH
jgi:hypothetical protein